MLKKYLFTLPLIFSLCTLAPACGGGSPATPPGGSENPPICGDGTLATTEACDDGNTINGDGCSSTCIVETASAACGNGSVESGEECDDGNVENGDGCSSTCTFETASAACGNGSVESGEECDDGDVENGDGCSSTCTIESTPAICGNGIKEDSEECDDGNQTDTDGCTNLCKLPVCGDGSKATTEACDDGNTNDGDGCSSVCIKEIFGNQIWAKNFGDTNLQFGKAIATDSNGNVFVAGYFAGTLDFGSPTQALISSGSNTNNDIFVVKFNPSGIPLWAQSFGDDEDQRISSLAVDGSGNAFVTGTYNGSITFGSTALTGGNPNIFVTKLNGNDGTTLWAKGFGGTTGSATTTGIAIDSQGDPVVAGYFGVGQIDLGSGNITNAGQNDIFVFKLANSGNGTTTWAKHFSTSSTELAYSLTIDPSDNSIFITGQCDSPIDFGGGALNCNAGSGYILKLDSSSNHIWSNLFGGSTTSDWIFPAAIALDSAHNVYFTGQYAGNVGIGGVNLPDGGAFASVFFAKFSGSGTPDTNLIKGFPNINNFQQARDIAVNSTGEIFIIGDFKGSINFGTGPLNNSTANNDIFIAKFDTLGSALEARRYGDTNTQNAKSLALDPSQNLLILGDVSGTIIFGGGPIIGNQFNILIGKLYP